MLWKSSNFSASNEKLSPWSAVNKNLSRFDVGQVVPTSSKRRSHPSDQQCLNAQVQVFCMNVIRRRDQTEAEFASPLHRSCSFRSRFLGISLLPLCRLAALASFALMPQIRRFSEWAYQGLSWLLFQLEQTIRPLPCGNDFASRIDGHAICLGKSNAKVTALSTIINTYRQ